MTVRTDISSANYDKHFKRQTKISKKDSAKQYKQEKLNVI